MSIEQRTTFILAEIQQIPLAEIAAMEGLPLGTVKSRISRTKERLRRVLKDLESAETDRMRDLPPDSDDCPTQQK